MSPKIDKEIKITLGLTTWHAPIKILNCEKQNLIPVRKRWTLLKRLQITYVLNGR